MALTRKYVNMFKGISVYRIGAKVYRGYEIPCQPLPEFLVRPQDSPEHSGKGRYDLDTGARHVGKFGTTSMPVPATSVSSV